MILHSQCLFFKAAIDMCFNSQIFLYVWNIAMLPVAKIQQAWDNFGWIGLYCIKFLAQQYIQRVQKQLLNIRESVCLCQRQMVEWDSTGESQHQ